MPHTHLARPRRLFAALAIGMLSVGCSDSEAPSSAPPSTEDRSVSAVDDAGRTVRLARPARRVVSLLPSVTETMVAFGAGELLAARTDYDEGLGVDHLESVGGGLTPSLEALVRHRPELVVAWEEAGGPRVRPRLEELGIPVFAVQTRDTASIFANIVRVGRLVGRDSAAAELAGRIRSELEEVRTSVAGRDTPTVLFAISTDPPVVVGSNLFISELIEVAGGRTAFPELLHSPQVSLEEIVRRRPDLIILPVSGRADEAVERLRGRPGWRELLGQPGVRVATVPADVVHRPGPSISASARLLRDAIHPALAADDDG